MAVLRRHVKLDVEKNKDEAGARYVAGFVLRKLLQKYKCKDPIAYNVLNGMKKITEDTEDTEWFVKGVSRGGLILLKYEMFDIVRDINNLFRIHFVDCGGHLNNDSVVMYVKSNKTVMEKWKCLVGKEVPYETEENLFTSLILQTVWVNGKCTAKTLTDQHRTQTHQSKNTAPMRSVLRDLSNK